MENVTVNAFTSWNIRVYYCVISVQCKIYQTQGKFYSRFGQKESKSMKKPIVLEKNVLS